MGESSLPDPPERRDDSTRRGRAPFPARLFGRGAQRVARATGIGGAAETVAEEAIVRAVESQAVERALARVLQGPVVEEAVEEAMRSPAVERALNEAIESEMIDRVWERLLASDEAQQLVERIAEAPEVRSAIAAQGVGLIDDMRREAARATHRLDDGFERVARRVFFRRAREAGAEEAGAVSRTIAMAIDAALLNAAFLALSGVITLVASLAFGAGGEASAPAIVIGAGAWITAGSLYLVSFWTLAGQTPGMRFVQIGLDSDRGGRIGVRAALRRLVGLVLAILPLGAGLLAVLFRDDRRGWHDRFAGTAVIYTGTAPVPAPWSAPGKPTGAPAT
ncbi:MAG: RDD family protein [Solirubrobacterales bacterium]